MAALCQGMYPESVILQEFMRLELPHTELQEKLAERWKMVLFIVILDFNCHEFREIRIASISFTSISIKNDENYS